MKNIWKYIHIKALTGTLVLFFISTTLAFTMFNCFPAAASFLTSIGAGCATGIVFYVIAIIRANDYAAYKSDYEYLKETYKNAGSIMHDGLIAIKLIKNNESVKEVLNKIVQDTEALSISFSALWFDCPKARKLIKEFPKDFEENFKLTHESLDILKSCVDGEIIEKEKAFTAIMTISTLCIEIETIILEPQMQLMRDIDYLDNAKF